MTARPDLAALAREFNQLEDEGANLGAVIRKARALAHAVLSEPAAEADGIDWKRRAADAEAELLALIQFRSGPQLDPTRLRRQEPTAMAALGDAVTECHLLRAQLAAAAPLFDAAVEYEEHHLVTKDTLVALVTWARSPEGERWKKEHG